MGDRGQDGNSHAIGFRRMDAPAIHDPKMRGLGIKVGETKSFCSFIPQEMQYPGTDALRIKRRKKSVIWWWLYACAKFGVTKKETKKHATAIFRPYAQTPAMGRSF